MRKILLSFAFLSSLVLILPESSSSQQKNQKKDTVTKEETTTQDYANLAPLSEISGKITEIDLKAGTLTLTIEWSKMAPNPNANNNAGNQKLMQQQQQLLNEYNAIMTAKNPVQQQQALARFQSRLQQVQATAGANAANMFQVVKSSKDFELKIIDKVKVARVKLEQKYTDEGEIIKYTAAELKKMKSPDLTNAYTAPAEDLKPGLLVKLYLSPPKKQSTKKAAASSGDDKDKKSGDDKDKSTKDGKDKQAWAAALASRSQVRMVLIMDEGAMPDSPPDAPKKKKDAK